MFFPVIATLFLVIYSSQVLAQTHSWGAIPYIDDDAALGVNRLCYGVSSTTGNKFACDVAAPEIDAVSSTIDMNSYTIINVNSISSMGTIAANAFQATGVSGTVGISESIILPKNVEIPPSPGAAGISQNISITIPDGANVASAPGAAGISQNISITIPDGANVPSSPGVQGIGIVVNATDNLGNHTATRDLNMNGNSIANVADISATGTVHVAELCDETGNNCQDISSGSLGGDDLGSHTAAESLDMSGNDITNTGAVYAQAVSLTSTLLLGTSGSCTGPEDKGKMLVNSRGMLHVCVNY